YYPGLVVEGEPAIADRQPFVSGVFGDVFDVLTATDGAKSPLNAYRAVVVGGRVDWSAEWTQKITDYVRNGGTVVVNAAQIKNLPAQLLGVRFTNAMAEADSARCEDAQDLSGQMFRYERLELKGAKALIAAPNGDPLVAVNKVGKGSVVLSALPDWLGQDERMTPFAAHMLVHIFADITPVKVTGDVEYLINRTATSWIITLLNNNGVFKTQQGMAQVDRSAYVTATIAVPNAKIQSATDWITDRALNPQAIRIPPGGVAVVEIRTTP
ncbi:MAG TPA: DUF4350 domain-containing protein, partial [Pyrinomonadaceae bacterium]|nr:DUF4350 domain-containing protein [Pyrinomonadaceae bacterium]